MALLNRRPQPSFYMPKFWPASQILGQILGEQIESVPADKIVGLIVTDQIASLAALKIEGKLTSEQIETLAAKQITGELTSAQIAEINAAKIVGQLTDSQLGGIAAAKIIGQLANGQILSLEAGKVTGQLTNAQIAALEAAKITGQLTNAQLVGLSSAKIEGLLTSEQIASLAVAKLVGQIVNSQIAAGAVTAGKISVAELSAISVNAGIIESGTFIGVTFRTPESDLILDKSGLRFAAGEAKTRTIEWLKSVGGSRLAKIYAIRTAGEAYFNFAVEDSERDISQVEVTSRGRSNNYSFLRVFSGKENNYVQVGAGTPESGGVLRTLFDRFEQSDFLQLATYSKKKIAFGTTTVSQTAGSHFLNPVKVNHGLGSTAVVCVATSDNAAITAAAIPNASATQIELRGYNSFGTEGLTTNIRWIAIG